MSPALSVVQTETGNHSGGGGSYSPAFGSAVTPGNTLLLALNIDTPTAGTASVAQPGTTWTKIVTQSSSGNGTTSEVWACTDNTSTSPSITVTDTHTANWALIELSGTSGVVDSYSVGSGSDTTTITSPALSPTFSGDFFLAVCWPWSNSTTGGPSGGWTAIAGGSNWWPSSPGYGVMAYYIASDSSDHQTTWTQATGGDSSSVAVAFAQTASPPTVTGVSPIVGGTAGGTNPITITGTGFTGATAVKFGSTNATSYTVDSSTSITATAPAGSTGTVNITVTTPSGTSATSSADEFTFETSPATSGSTVTVDNDGTYNAFPGLCLGADGKLHGVWKSGTGHATGGEVVYSVSSNSGATWSTPTTILTPTGSNDYQDVSLGCTSTGRLILNGILEDGASNTIDCYTIYSDNNGDTWSSPATLYNPYSVTASISTSGPVVQLSDGDLVMPIYGYNTGDAYNQTGLIRSTDNGMTWGSYVRIGASNAGFGEATIIQRTNGHLLCALRNDMDEYLYTSISTDDGATWSSPGRILADSSGRPAMGYFSSADAVALFYRDNPGETGYPSYVTSVDGGSTWTTKTVYTSVGDYVYAAWAPLDTASAFVILGIQLSLTDAEIIGQKFTGSIPSPPPHPSGWAQTGYALKAGGS